MQATHEDYMALAINNAKMGWGLTKTNPMVGAVLVKDEKVIATGFHQYFGGPHAEADLFSKTEDTEGATLYVTMEPCFHTNKKTPPCTPLVIEKKIAKLVVGMRDPNPETTGKGLEQIKAAGIEVIEGVLEKEVQGLNPAFTINMNEQRSFVHLKIAQTQDQTLVIPERQWITGDEVRRDVHWMRAQCQAIMVGGETFRTDSPELTVRGIHLLENEHFEQPRRLVLSRTLKELEGFEAVQVNDWNQFLKDLYKEGIGSLYIEAGPNLAKELIENKVYDYLSVMEAPFKAEGIRLDTELPELSEIRKYSNGDRWLICSQA